MAKPRLNVAFLTGDTSLNVSLLRALLPPTSPQPQEYGWNTAPVYSEFESQTRRYTAVEYGHMEKPRRHLLNAAPCLDGVVLSVFASEGLGVVTREHILLLREAGIQRIAVFVDTSNLIGEPEVADLTEAQVRITLAEYGFPADDFPVVRGNLLAIGRGEEENPGRCLDELHATLDLLIPAPCRAEHEPFLLSVDAVAPINNGTTAANGWAVRGRVENGDELEVVGGNGGTRRVMVARVWRVATAVKVGRAGRRLRVALRDPQAAPEAEPRPRRRWRGEHRPGPTLERGQVLAAPGSVQVFCRFDADCYLATRREGGREDSLGDGEQVQFLLRSREVPGVVRLLGEEQQVWPGRRFRMRAELPADGAMVMSPGFRFAFRGEEGLSGYGVVEQVYR
jgi:elongation factor Tu